MTRVSGNEVWEDVFSHMKVVGDIVKNKKDGEEYEIVSKENGTVVIKNLERTLTFSEFEFEDKFQLC